MTLVDPLTDTTTQTWYAAGDVSLSNPLHSTVSTTDAAGNVTSTTEYGYPATGTAWQQLSSWTATYNDLNEVTSSTESFYVGGPSGGTMVQGQTLAYSYNNDGQETSLTYTSQGQQKLQASYTIDPQGRTSGVTQMADGLTESATLVFDLADRATSLTRSGGSDNTSLLTTFGYGANGLLSSLTHSSGGQTLTSFSWMYNSNEQITQKTYVRTQLKNGDTRIYSVGLHSLLP